MKGIKIAAVVLCGIILFIVGVLAESHLRSLARKPIPVVIADDLPAEVEAYVQPDFLWAGEAWWIRITSRTPVQLDIDGEWEAAIPPGTNTLYSNHDVNNTTKFGTNRWWKTPSTITVKKRPQQAESTVPVKAAPSASSTVR